MTISILVSTQGSVLVVVLGLPLSQERTLRLDSTRFAAAAFSSGFKQFRTTLAATLENCR